MAFLVEDGTGLAESTSYVDVTYADAYFVRIGFTGWASKTVDEKQTALESGAEYADLRWGARIRGTLLVLTQALQFPRKQINDRYGRAVSGVPNDWKKAVCEYAMQGTRGSLISETVSADQNVKKKKTVVGPITTEKEFFNQASSIAFTSYPKADNLVKQFLGPNYGLNGGKTIRN